MTTDDSPSIPPTCLTQFSITPVRYLGGRQNKHWLVESASTQHVLRAYAEKQAKTAAYEHEVLNRLHRLGWPVPELVATPIHEAGRLWCLFTRLPGASLATESSDDRRARGRLLAEFHASTATLTDIGQRLGFATAVELVRNPALLRSVHGYERLNPDAGHVLRWHLERAIELFDRVPLADVKTVILHSDFAPWNLLFENGKLSGVLDFESTHRNHCVSDFALAWRGYQHEVIVGYEEVQPLTDRDRALLLPALWSWLFLGVHDEIAAMRSGVIPAHGFDWQVKQFLKRSPLHDVGNYPGRLQ